MHGSVLILISTELRNTQSSCKHNSKLEAQRSPLRNPPTAYNRARNTYPRNSQQVNVNAAFPDATTGSPLPLGFDSNDRIAAPRSTHGI